MKVVVVLFVINHLLFKRSPPAVAIYHVKPKTKRHLGRRRHKKRHYSCSVVDSPFQTR